MAQNQIIPRRLWKIETTHRGVATHSLRTTALGFITPIVLEAKLLYRNLCEKKLDWVESMPAEDLLRWQRWLENLMHLRMVSIPGWLDLDSSKDHQTCQLHYFVDASQLAYGAVSYLRVVDHAGNASCSLVTSKSYLVPKNEISIPRLELLGAVTARDVEGEAEARKTCCFRFHIGYLT